MVNIITFKNLIILKKQLSSQCIYRHQLLSTRFQLLCQAKIQQNNLRTF